jgi:hypothetical protein
MKKSNGLFFLCSLHREVCHWPAQIEAPKGIGLRASS